MRFFKSICRMAAGLRLGTLLLYGIVLGGCAQVATVQGNGISSLAQSTPFPLVCPCSPEELWLRLLEVIKTNPDKLSHHKIGGIFGLEFDEKKILWHDRKESNNYFYVTKQGIKNNIGFPFWKISLSQSGHYNATGRLMLFDMDIFNVTPDLQALLEQSEKHCVKPNISQIEALGFFYDEISSSMPPPTDRNGRDIYRPYREEVFVDSLSNRLDADKTIYLRVLQNGCLVGVRYDVQY